MEGEGKGEGEGVGDGFGESGSLLRAYFREILGLPRGLSP